MAISVPEWLTKRLEMLFRPRCPQLGSGALGLPPEIILMIATYLTNPSLISLALTCRTLHWLCFPQHPTLTTAEKEELLLLLEKDFTTLYFCHHCAKLHRWQKLWGNLIPLRVEGNLPCRKQVGRTSLLLSSACNIPYHHARLIMNQHFYGPRHGLPLHKFDRWVRILCPLSGVLESESMHARIVDDKLLLLSVMTTSHPRGDSKTLRSYVDKFGDHVCGHLTLARTYDPREQLPELAKDTTAPGYFTPCDQSFGSCTLCLTDYCIDIAWRGRRKGYIIKVYAYRQLGDCRSPFAWDWHSMTTTRQTADESRMTSSLEYRPGIVRDRWNKAEGVYGRTEDVRAQLRLILKTAMSRGRMPPSW